MNAAKSERTGTVLMKSRLPEQTCQALISRQLNDVLKQWNLAKDITEQFCVTRTQKNGPDISEEGEQVKIYENHIQYRTSPCNTISSIVSCTFIHILLSNIFRHLNNRLYKE